MPQDNERTEHHRRENARGDRSRGERSAAGKTSAQSEMAASGVKTGLRVQKQMLDVLNDIGQEWFARATSQAEFALKLPNRLTSAHTVPEAFSAYREWLGEWISMCDEDTRRFMADSQKIVDQSMRCFTESAPGATT